MNYDITFCSNSKCKNTKCNRNQANLYLLVSHYIGRPVSIGEFKKRSNARNHKSL